MQQSQNPSRTLLTALEVQELLHIDRSTVYRMAEDGRLPAIRVGRSWRFPAERIHALLAASPGRDAVERPLRVVETTADGTDEASPADGADGPAVNVAAAGSAISVAAELLGVMMVVTDMHGRPVTDVVNQCEWFASHGAEPGVLDRCVAEWRDLADHPDLAPRFQAGALGFQCARAFIRHGSTLVGMVLAGGVSPAIDGATDPDLHHLDEAERERVLAALPRIAAAISTTMKEN